MTIPIFTINLDSRPDRWSLLSENLDGIGLKATRIDAVDKLAVADDPMTLYLGVGHVACYRSHCLAMQAFLGTNAPAALILEDDAELHPSLAEVLADLCWLPPEYGLVKMGTVLDLWDHTVWLGHPVGSTGHGHELRPIMHRDYGAEGYLINRATAAEALACTTRLSIDHLLFDLSYSELARKWQPIQLLPAPIRQRPYQLVGSDTGDEKIEGARRYIPSLASRLPNKLKLNWQSLTGHASKMRVPFGAS